MLLSCEWCELWLALPPCTSARLRLRWLLRWLPLLASLADAELDVSDEGLRLHVAGAYLLEMSWPRPVVADDAKAKFSRKTRTLTITLPLRPGGGTIV